MAERKKQSVLNGALILAIALIAVKVIGALFKIPISDTLGLVGRGYFDAAYNIYTPIYAIAMAGLPVAVSRMVSESVATHRFREVHVIQRVAKMMFLCLGIVGTIVLLAIAYPYAKRSVSIDSLPSIICIAPSIFFCCVMSAYRGYYEGLRNMVPTAMSQFVEALGKLIIGVGLAKFIMYYGEKIYQDAVAGELSEIIVFGTKVTTKAEMYGAIYPWAAAGAIIGVTAGSMLGMLFLMIYHKARGDGITRVELANSPRAMEGTKVAKKMIAIAIPVVASSLVLNLTNIIDTVTIQSCIKRALAADKTLVYQMYKNSFDTAIANNSLDFSDINKVASYLWGAYGTVLDFRNLIPTITASLGTSALPALAAAWATKDGPMAKSTVNTVLRICLLVALPAGIGMAVLAEPILSIVYSGGNSADGIQIIVPILKMFGYSTALMSIATPITSMLQAIGRTDIPIKSMLVGSAAKIACNYFLVSTPSINIRGAAVGTIVCYTIMVGVNLFYLLRLTKVKVSGMQVLVKPLLCSILCGFSAWAAHGIFTKLLAAISPSLVDAGRLSASNIAAVLAIGIAVLVYAIAVLFMRVITREDVQGLPKGEKIAKVLEKHRLLG